MKLKLYSLKDTVVGVFGNIIPSENDSVAIRNVSYIINHTDSLSFVKDKQLFCLGTFDNETGEIKPENRFIVSCVDLIEGVADTKKVEKEVVLNEIPQQSVIS